MSDDRNPLFNLLAGDRNDLEGLTAYALYKRHKRRWAAEFRERESREPTAEEERTFALSVATGDQLDRYKKDAQDLLVSFANAFVEDERANIEKDAISGRIETAATKVEKANSFSSLLLVGFVSTIMASAFFALIALSTDLFGVDMIDALQGLSSPEAIGSP